MMTFGSAIEHCLRHYATFQGRASRSEYWFFILFACLVTMAALIVDAILGTSGGGVGIGLFYLLAMLGLFVPSLAVAVRRLHDIDRSGWWYLIGLIPLIGGIILFIWFCTAGTPGPNKYGKDPLSDFSGT